MLLRWRLRHSRASELNAERIPKMIGTWHSYAALYYDYGIGRLTDTMTKY